MQYPADRMYTTITGNSCTAAAGAATSPALDGKSSRAETARPDMSSAATTAEKHLSITSGNTKGACGLLFYSRFDSRSCRGRVFERRFVSVIIKMRSDSWSDSI